MNATTTLCSSSSCCVSPSFFSSPCRSFPNSSITFRNPSRCSSASGPLVIETEDDEIAEEATTTTTKPLVSRRLILLRHANSSWEDRSLRDHDRPLSKVGRADAIDVSQKLLQLGWVPELILSSNAARTKETLKIMQEQVRGFLEAEVHFFSSFYSIAAMDGQTAEHLQQAICKYSRDDIFTVMCMGHNRGWEEAASMLTGSLVELKTCNAALLEATGKSWDEVLGRNEDWGSAEMLLQDVIDNFGSQLGYKIFNALIIGSKLKTHINYGVMIQRDRSRGLTTRSISNTVGLRVICT